MTAFAVIPAAGKSQRMGTQKLLLPWGDQQVVTAMLSNWAASAVAEIVMVLSPQDEQVLDVCLGMDSEREIDFLTPEEPPAEMKHSIRLALVHIQITYAPDRSDCWLMAPADMPNLASELIDELIAIHKTSDRSKILVPRFGGKRGHPILVPWHFVPQVFELPDDQGLNYLLQSNPVEYVDTECAGCLEDLDTPDEYEALRNRMR